MPSPRPPSLGLRSFPSHRAPRGPAAAIPARAKELVELMVFGAGSTGPMNLKEVAAHMGLKIATAAAYLRHPRARAAYMEMLRGVREAEYAKNTEAAAAIRDDPGMARSAAGNRARIESMRLLEGDKPPSRDPSFQRQTTPGVVVQVMVNSGPRVVDDEIINVGIAAIAEAERSDPA